MPSPVTICITSYNYKEYLPECLDSVINQQYEPMEILIYDDCSTDYSLDIIHEYMKNDSRIILEVGDKNEGPNAGVNWALRNAAGKFFAILCSDDRLVSNYWETLLPYFEDPEIGFVRIACMLFGESIVGESLFRPLNLNNRLDILEGNRVFVSSPFRMAMQKEIGLFDVNTTFSDWDFWIRCILSKWKWVTYYEPMFFRRIHKDSITYKLGIFGNYNIVEHKYMENKWKKTLDLFNVKQTTMRI